MRKEQITDKEAICLLIIFIMGSTLILGTGGTAKNDAWIAGILGIVMAVPVVLIYARILSLFPGKDLYEILEVLFGNILGRFISLIYIWYSFHLGALVIRNFGEFINTVTMPETPMIVPMLFLGLVSITAVRSGIEVMSRVSAYILPLIMFTIILVQFLGISKFEIRNLKPFFGNGFAPILMGAFSAFSFPYAETILFTGVLFCLKGKKSPYKVYLTGLIFAGTLIVIITIRNILVLGGMIESLYFPSHVAVSRIRIGDFIERIEVTVSLLFVFGVFTKTSVCLFVASKGIASIFRLQDYNSVVIQLGLLMVYFSYNLYDTIMEMEYWAFKVYAYYAFPFQVIIPIVIWITAELKSRNCKTVT